MRACLWIIEAGGDALCTPAGAVICRPGAPSRRGETEGMREVLAPFFTRIAKVEPPGTLEAGACVVNISSQAARDGGGIGSALYGASKAAVSTFTRAMAKEFGPKGVRVNAVCPGLIDTLFHDTFTSGVVRTRVSRMTPLRREGAPMEVADLVCFLASDQASFITGANYDINGGLVFS